MRSLLTGEDEGDESEQPVAAPEDNARERDVTGERLDVMDNHRLLIAAHHNLKYVATLYLVIYRHRFFSDTT